MTSPQRTTTSEGCWTSLWVIAGISLIGQLAICQFFSFGQFVPMTIDMNPSNLWKLAYHFPPTTLFLVLNWFGVANTPTALSPFSLAALWPTWLFFTTYAPLIGSCSLLAMAAFLRELELPRPAALFGGVIYAWQGDFLPFVLPGHFAYITFWPFFAVAAWSTLRAQRTGHWAYALMSGAACGTMVALPTAADRGAIASLFIAVLYLAPVICGQPGYNAVRQFLHLALCAVSAFLIAIASLLALFQSQITGVKMGGHSHFEETYQFCTQFSLGPWESLTYLVPGLFGWHSNSDVGPYWGWIGQVPGWSVHHEGLRNLNLAISTTGAAATVLGLIGACAILPWGWLGRAQITDRSRFYARVLLIFGAIALVLSWGYHTPFYRPLFVLPLMDKWRNPLKWLEIFNFAVIALSAVGMQHLMATFSFELPEQKIVRRRIAWFSGLVLGFFLLGLIASYLLENFLANSLLGSQYSPDEVDLMVATTHASLKMAFMVMAFFCLLLYVIWHPDRLDAMKLPNPLLDHLWHLALRPANRALTLALGMSLIAVIQLAWVTSHFIQRTSFAALTSTDPLVEALRSEGDQVRVSVAVEDPILNILLQNQFNAAGISSVDISAASRIPDDINAFFKALGADRERLWFLAGVKNVAVPQEFMPQLRADPILAANIDHANGYTLVPTSNPDIPSHALLGMKDYLSKATLVSTAEFIPFGDGMLKRLADHDWNPRASILLDPSLKRPAQEAVKFDPSIKNAIDLLLYTPTKIAIHVKSVTGGYVLINDQYDPDWQVQVNGHAAQLLRADYLLRAVEVPPGESTVTMRYVAHYHVGNLDLPVRAMHLFSDTIMLASWIIAALALRRRNGVA